MKLTFICKRTGGILMLILLLPLPLFAKKMTAPQGETLLIYTQEKEAEQENRRIEGTVTDENGETVIGATVMVKGSPENGTVTGIDGKFSLEIEKNMESQKPKIAMYVKRPFGEKLNASFDFIKENWKQLFKYSTYLILPICLIQAANFSGLMGSMTDLTAMQASGGISDNPLAALGPSFALNYAGVIFFSCLGALLMTSLIYAMVRLYNEREERLSGIVFGDIKSLLLRNIKRLFLMGIACSFLFIFAVIFIVLLAVLTPFTLILTIPLLFAFMVPLALMAPIYLFEDISLGEAFAKTFRLGFATWGGVFLILIVMGIIASVLQGIVSIPWYVIYIVKMIFTMSDGGATSSSVGLNFAQYLFSILMLYGSYLSAIFGIVGLVYQYGHASEVVDSITVESDIDNFDKL